MGPLEPERALAVFLMGALLIGLLVMPQYASMADSEENANYEGPGSDPQDHPREPSSD